MTREGSESRRARDRWALALFAGGAVVLFAFFAAGAYIGRSSRAPADEEPREAAPARPAPQRMVRVEAEAAESRERADEVVAALRRKYTSAAVEQDRADGRFHVYVGPYPERDAEAVAAEIRDLGYDQVRLLPFARQP